MDEMPDTTQTYSEAEIRQAAEMLGAGIVPVARYELDEVVDLVDRVAETLDKVFSNDKLGKEDFAALQPLWDQAWVVKEHFQQIEDEAKHLGLIGKITMVVRGFGSLNRLFKAIKRAKD